MPFVQRASGQSVSGLTGCSFGAYHALTLALRHPDTFTSCVTMGGAFGLDDANAAAEFNVRHDPEAAAMTLRAATELGVPMTWYGLDVFFLPTVSRAQAQPLVASGGRSAAELAATGGEDFELCACVPPGRRAEGEAAGLTWVGEVVAGAPDVGWRGAPSGARDWHGFEH